MSDHRPELRIKGLSADRMERLQRFTRALNAELARLGGEPIDVIEAHQKYQGQIDDHEGTWADLIAKIAAERSAKPYVEDDEGPGDNYDEFEWQDENE